MGWQITTLAAEGLVEIGLFPDISARGLASTRPSYTTLRQRHSRTVRIWLTLRRSTDGAELGLVRVEDGDYELLALMQDIVPNHETPFGYNPESTVIPIWWAVRSVIDDPKYPYRRPGGK